MSTPATQAPNALKIGVIYFADNGRRVCAKCAGMSATTGRDKSGKHLVAIPHEDIDDWRDLFGRDLACEAGCTVYFPLSFASKLRAARRKADMTQAEAAARCGVSVRALQIWECGKRPPSLAAQTGSLTLIEKP